MSLARLLWTIKCYMVLTDSPTQVTICTIHIGLQNTPLQIALKPNVLVQVSIRSLSINRKLDLSALTTSVSTLRHRQQRPTCRTQRGLTVVTIVPTLPKSSVLTVKPLATAPKRTWWTMKLVTNYIVTRRKISLKLPDLEKLVIRWGCVAQIISKRVKVFARSGHWWCRHMIRIFLGRRTVLYALDAANGSLQGCSSVQCVPGLCAQSSAKRYDA